MKPSLPQQIDFLFQTYFGVNGDKLDRFISRAYRDMNRTLRGIGKLNKKRTIFTGANTLLKNAVSDLSKKVFPKNLLEGRQVFDRWHTDLCLALKDHYGAAWSNNRKMHLTYGQAQKWVNMTIKYCWVCGGKDTNGLGLWFSVAHVAVDRIILVAAQKTGAVSEQPCRVWSAWDNQQEYQGFQNSIRAFAAAQDKSPLELEFNWWQEFRKQAPIGEESK